MEFSPIIDQISLALRTPLREMAEAIGERDDRFYKLKANGARPNHEILQKLVLTFPQINAEFLLTGQGDVLKKEPVSSIPEDLNKDTIIQSLAETIQRLKKRNEELEALSRNPESVVSAVN